MVDPCFAADGHSYERANITAWLASHDAAAHERNAAAQDGRPEPRAALIWGFGTLEDALLCLVRACQFTIFTVLGQSTRPLGADTCQKNRKNPF